jgi:predicted RNase H-like HicB family nuclease
VGKSSGSISPFRIELDRESDGRFIAEIPDLPGVMVYGATRVEAIERVKILAMEIFVRGSAS